MRKSVEESWRWLEANGWEAPRTAAGQAFISPQMPSYDDEELALSFFRTLLEDAALDYLTLSRTYFGRSSLTRVSFQGTDLRESRMCWNDFNQCDFTDADLFGCDMRGSRWQGCSFVRTNLSRADLRNSSIVNCDFTDALLDGAHLVRGQGFGLKLDHAQRDAVTWHWMDGPEPPGG